MLYVQLYYVVTRLSMSLVHNVAKKPKIENAVRIQGCAKDFTLYPFGSGLRKFALDFVVVIFFRNAKQNCKWHFDFVVVNLKKNILCGEKYKLSANFLSPKPNGQGYSLVPID